ncbi:VRR-NUC domain-containing protein [Lactobacillus crispatus]|uniref:VRR-NUC domain-containing protein n=1 Tax=Lactobacillus crispatus TaxID=47770 RepID=UPI0029C400FA|nr:VRR-NUC domain-containing protein [Lactobacillus crispatus]MDX5091623.1 VRR-NUC domain-containing protein [Lactobacillus crispatus]
MTRESLIQGSILRYLNSLPGCYAINNHGNSYQGAGRPDIFASYNGRFLAFEVKNESGKPTKLQIHELSKWEAAGAVAGIVRSVDDVKKLIEGIE